MEKGSIQLIEIHFRVLEAKNFFFTFFNSIKFSLLRSVSMSFLGCLKLLSSFELPNLYNIANELTQLGFNEINLTSSNGLKTFYFLNQLLRNLRCNLEKTFHFTQQIFLDFLFAMPLHYSPTFFRHKLCSVFLLNQGQDSQK